MAILFHSTLVVSWFAISISINYFKQSTVNITLCASNSERFSFLGTHYFSRIIESHKTATFFVTFLKIQAHEYVHWELYPCTWGFNCTVDNPSSIFSFAGGGFDCGENFLSKLITSSLGTYCIICEHFWNPTQFCFRRPEILSLHLWFLTDLFANTSSVWH